MVGSRCSLSSCGLARRVPDRAHTSLDEQKVIFDLRSRSFRHVERVAPRWFDNRADRDLITRVVEDVNSVERVLIDGIEQGVVAILQVAIVSVALFFQRPPRLGLLARLPLLGRRRDCLYADWPSRYRPQRRAASAGTHSCSTIWRAFGRSTSSCGKSRNISGSIAPARHSDRRRCASCAPGRFTVRAMDFVNSLGLVLAIVFGGRAVLRGELQLGSLVAFITLTRFLYEP